MPKIVLFGLQPKQQRILTEQLPELNIRYIDADRRQFQLPQADLVVICTKFVSHRITEAVVSQSPVSIHIHRGGMKEIKRFLQDWNRFLQDWNCKNLEATGGK